MSLEVYLVLEAQLELVVFVRLDKDEALQLLVAQVLPVELLAPVVVELLADSADLRKRPRNPR